MATLRKFFTATSLFFCFFGYTDSFAQHYYTRHLTIKDGLPSNTVRSIFKDSRGVLWIGTDAGLCTFDGREFKRFPLLSENRSNKVWTIAEDDAGNLWFGTYGSGLFKYDGRSLVSYKKPTIPSQYIRTLKYSTKYRCLLIGTEHGFCCYKDSEFKSYPIDPIDPKKKVQVMGFSETERGINYYTYFNYGYTFYPKENKVAPIPLTSPINSKSTSGCFITSKADTIVGVLRTGIKVISKSGVTEYNNIGQVFDIKEDKHGVIWCAAWSYTDMVEQGGFFILNNQGKPESVNSRYQIDDKLAWCIYFDNDEGVTYLGTEDNGFYAIPDRGIAYFDSKYFGVEKLGIYDMLEMNNDLWITAESNVIVGKPDNGFKVLNAKYFSVNSTSGYTNQHIKTGEAQAIKFWDIELDESNNLWISSILGLYKINGKKLPVYYGDEYAGVFENFKINTEGLVLGGSWCAHNCIPNVYKKWGLVCLNGNRYPTDITKIITRRDEVWFCSWNQGLYRYKEGKYKSYAQTDSLIPTNLKDLCIDKKGNLITGTNDGKVLILEGNDRLKVKYELSEKEGIVGNSIIWLFCSKNNDLWIGTNSGMNVLSLNELYAKGRTSIRYFNSDEGFNELSIRPVLEDKEGFLWLGGKDNLVKIDPKKLLSIPSKTKLVLESIDINNQEFDWNSIAATDRWSHLPTERVNLDYNQNSLIFRFKTTNTLNPSKDEYSVYLEGFDKKASGWNSKADATYTNLPAGDYKLTIKGKNISSQQDYKPIVFTFSIHPPWWRTWWFYGGVALLILILINRLFAYRLRIANEKNSVEQRISELRLEALKAQMNPHFIFNAFNSLQLYILKKETTSALDYMSKFAILIRKMLEYASNKRIQLSEEIDFLENYLYIEQKRVSNLSFSFIIDQDIDTEATFLPPMMIQPLIENALLHGIRHNDKDGQITVEFRLEKEHLLRCIVVDNGVGRAKSAEIYAAQQKTHTSRSTAITEERIRLLNASSGEVNIRLEYTDLQENGIPSGTRVELVIVI